MADSNLFSEASGDLQFCTQFHLWEHVKKHVCKREEKWRTLEGFDADLIKKAQQDIPPQNNQALQQLAKQYQTLISNILTQACAQCKNHFHIFEEYPSATVKLLMRRDSEPQQIIIALGISQKIVAVASKNVIKGPSAQYILVTAYRTLLEEKAWLKRQRSRWLELDHAHHGKKVSLIADHSVPENKTEKDG